MRWTKAFHFHLQSRGILNDRGACQWYSKCFGRRKEKKTEDDPEDAVPWTRNRVQEKASSRFAVMLSRIIQLHGVVREYIREITGGKH